MNRAIVGLGLALVLGCHKPCDEAELAAIADGSLARSLEARYARREAIVEACPQMSSELASSLRLSNDEWAPGSSEERAAAREYAALRSATCPVAGDEWQRALAAEDRDAAVFSACGFDRYALLDADEAFLFDDFESYMLYEWMTSRRIDPDLARRVVRGQMLVNSTPEELLELCREWWVACRVAYEQVGVTLPASRGTRNRVYWSTSDLLVTADGRVLGSPDDPTKLDLVADAGAAWGVVVDTLFDAVRASEDGLPWMTFLVLMDHDKRWILVKPGSLWSPPVYRPHEVTSPRLVITMGRDAIELRQGYRQAIVATSGDCTSPTTICFDPESLRPVLEQLKHHVPLNDTAELRVAREIAYQQVVWLLEVTRGEQCYVNTVEPPSEGCLFRELVVDANPPMYRNMDATFSFGEPTAKVVGDELRLAHVRVRSRRPISPEDALALFETKRDELLACVLADLELVAGTSAGSELTIFWGPSPSKRELGVAIVPSDGRERPEQTRCIARALAVDPVVARDIRYFVATADVELKVPILIEPAAKRTVDD